MLVTDTQQSRKLVQM